MFSQREKNGFNKIAVTTIHYLKTYNSILLNANGGCYLYAIYAAIPYINNGMYVIFCLQSNIRIFYIPQCTHKQNINSQIMHFGWI